MFEEVGGGFVFVRFFGEFGVVDVVVPGGVDEDVVAVGEVEAGYLRGDGALFVLPGDEDGCDFALLDIGDFNHVFGCPTDNFPTVRVRDTLDGAFFLKHRLPILLFNKRSCFLALRWSIIIILIK